MSLEKPLPPIKRNGTNMLSEPNSPMWCVVEFVLFDLRVKTWPWQSFLKRTCFNSWKAKWCSNSEKCPDNGLNNFRNSMLDVMIVILL